LRDFGIDGARSFFSGFRESLSFRLFSATPPAIPATAAPAATSGVFAFEATFEIFAPTPLWGFGVDARFADLPVRLLAEVRPARREAVAPAPFELERFVLDLALVRDEPFLFVDLFALELLRVERLLEDRVVWAILLASLVGFLASGASLRRRIDDYPLARGLNRSGRLAV
jgi:hypothetical protein